VWGDAKFSNVKNMAGIRVVIIVPAGVILAAFMARYYSANFRHCLQHTG
jgi:hypothetical protein